MVSLKDLVTVRMLLGLSWADLLGMVLGHMCRILNQSTLMLYSPHQDRRFPTKLVLRVEYLASKGFFHIQPQFLTGFPLPKSLFRLPSKFPFHQMFPNGNVD